MSSARKQLILNLLLFLDGSFGLVILNPVRLTGRGFTVSQLPVALHCTTDTKEYSSSPLSLTLDKLALALGGRGRALSCWECFRNGVDPSWLFQRSFHVSDDQREVEPGVECLSSSGLWKRSQFQHQGPLLGSRCLRKLDEMPRIEGQVGRLTHLTKSKDGTTKLLLKLQDDFEVETVIIPWDDRQRSTLCISSQVGCRQGCVFCATGRMGKLRSLTSDEILAQVYFANKVCRVENIHSIDNIVFMGMGEPADNAAAVVQAAKILVDRNMFGLASRRVTISTVGPSPDSFATLAEAPVVLAWSVHATRQDVREALVPTTKYSMKELRDGLLKALDGRSRALKSTMLEVTLLNGINDRPEDALDMVDFCQPISDRTSKVVVNLIPWNDIGASSGAAAFFEKPLSDRVLAFQKTLTEHGIRCYIRTTRGDEDSSACGQLATKRKTTGRSAP